MHTSSISIATFDAITRSPSRSRAAPVYAAAESVASHVCFRSRYGKDLVGGWAPCNGSLQRIHSNSEARAVPRLHSSPEGEGPEGAGGLVRHEPRITGTYEPEFSGHHFACG